MKKKQDMETAIKSLSIEEKMALVGELWEEIENERVQTLSQNQMKHIRKRIEEHNLIGNQGKNWEEIKDKYVKH